jgi:hypothetical protein
MRFRVFGSLLTLGCLAAAQQVTSDTYRGGLVTPPLPKPRFVLTVSAAAKKGTSLAVETEPVVGLRSGLRRIHQMKKKRTASSVRPDCPRF